MSQQLINAYLKELATLRRIGGTTEGVTSEAFKDLLKAWARPLGFTFIPQHAFTTTAKMNNRVDGAIMLERFPIGYWEAKDEDDDLDVEIEKKFRRGYPKTNIIFEDTHRAVLWQHGKFVMDCAVTDGPELGKLLDIFFGYEREETTNFKKAVAQFKVDLPPVLDILREQIDAAQANVPAFQTAAAAFLKQAKQTINPSVTAEDVREMLIQHILTENIFAKVFGDDEFHRKNNVAQALYALEDTFFSGDVRRRTRSKLSFYYSAIESAAAKIPNHSEKQGFLKAIYEGFYKVYNAKAADRLGVVYTPNEIVRFMVESADWLCEKHFKKNLIDRDVEILDPATGTGTFIVELLEHFSGQPEKLKHKYAEELHANEVAILPYYVANLNIEATYNAITGGYAEFPGLCFVDTLDNVAALGIYSGHQYDLLGGMSDENADRVKRQNSRKISVVIGNPPYNAWQENYNQNNANRPYSRVDQRIGATYIKEGTAQNKNSVYDMYTRFIRWASDRVKDEGVIAFIIGRKPFAKAAYDGFRKVIAREFAEIWVFDLGGDVRDNPKLSGTKHNVFGIQTGVAMVFLVKKKGKSGGAVIRYARRPEMETAEEKLAAVSAIGGLGNLAVETIQPDKKNDWLNQSEGGWENLLPLVDHARTSASESGIFKLSSNGVETKKDEWLYARSEQVLRDKMEFYIQVYEQTRQDRSFAGRDSIKWDRETERNLKSAKAATYKPASVANAAYRPFGRRKLYLDRQFLSVMFNNDSVFPRSGANHAIAFLGIATKNPLAALAVSETPDRCYLKNGNGGTQLVSRYRFNKAGDRLDNITDWALTQFRTNHAQAASSQQPAASSQQPAASSQQPAASSQQPRGYADSISKDDIFAYVYAVLHDPVYRETYALNLKREFPRIPLYPDFKRWRDWGQALLDLHIGYETAAPAALTRTDTPDPKRAPDTTPVVKLKSDPEGGIIVLDADTQLSGVPLEAWRYRLGNRSAIDWVLDQHKEKKPKDPTIAAKFNTYRFADYKEAVVDLLARVVTVSVKTVAITDAMAALPAAARTS